MVYIAYIWSTLMAIFLVREVCAFCGIAASRRFLLRSVPPPEATGGSGPGPDVYVLVPVLREAGVIEATVRHFLSLGICACRIVVVTTEREMAESEHRDGPRTSDVLEQLREVIPFTHLHYPHADGTKADQLNYAIRVIGQSLAPDRQSSTFFAFYDADSRPHARTFDAFRIAVTQYPTVRAFQQHSFFYSNVRRLATTGHVVTRAFLLANAIRQTRFTLAYEVPRLRARLAYYMATTVRRRWSVAALCGRFRYAHTVGHGLFVRADLMAAVPFPEGSVLEDMFYGFIMNVMHEPVVPLGVVDDCETPGQVSTLYRQRSRWFLGPSRPFEYMRYSRANVVVRAAPCERLAIAASSALDALVWAMQTPVFVGSLLCGVVWLVWAPPAVGAATLISACAGVAYVATVAFTISIPCERLGVLWAVRRSEAVLAMAALPLVVLFHSLPAYHNIYHRIFHQPTASAYGKTER